MSAASRRSPRQRTVQGGEASSVTEQEATGQAPAEAAAQPDGAEQAAVELVVPVDVRPAEVAPAAADESAVSDSAEEVDAPGPPSADRTADGRPLCRVGRDVAPDLPACDKPEFIDDYGICGGHYAVRPDLRREAYRAR